MAIMGLHAIKYDRQPEETRAFIRDVLGWKFVDVGRGWLIFAAPPTELAVHPSEGTEQVELYLMCDDIEKTRGELAAKGVTMSAVHEERWGRLAHITLPNGEPLGIYEPKHPLAIQPSPP